MYDLAYHRSTTAADAAARLAAHGDATLLAGGQTLLPVLRSRLAGPSMLVDIGHLAELKGITRSSDRLVVGASETHAEVAASPVVAAAAPALARLAAGIGDPMVRHRGTIGGSIANNDPAACYPAAVLALDAVIVTDRRRVAAADFFTAMFTTALQAGEIITAIDFPVGVRAHYVKFANPASRFAMLGVFSALLPGSTRIAVTGGGTGVFRWRAAEAHIDAGGDSASIAALSLAEDHFNPDLHGSIAYRQQLTRAMTARCLAALALP
jgi:carbon-monoxide dehydrogenase medium subunit